MQDKRNILLLSVLGLTLGALILFAQHQHPLSGKAIAYNIQQGKYISRQHLENAPPASFGVLALADGNRYPHLPIRAYIRRKMAEIVSRLEAETESGIQQTVQTWKQAGGYFVGKTPNLLLLNNTLRNHKEEAEEEAYRLLNSREQEAWEQRKSLRTVPRKGLEVVE